MATPTPQEQQAALDRVLRKAGAKSAPRQAPSLRRATQKSKAKKSKSEPSLAQALHELAQVMRSFTARQEQPPVVKVSAAPRKTRTVTHRDAEGLIKYTETEVVEP